MGSNTKFVNYVNFDSSHNLDKKKKDFKYTPDIWTIFFYGSKSREGVRDGYLLIDMRGTHNFISCSLEFYCSNNTIEYEALVQVLKKSIDLKITKKNQIVWRF
jgi:hypothetical protein